MLRPGVRIWPLTPGLTTSTLRRKSTSMAARQDSDSHRPVKVGISKRCTGCKAIKAMSEFGIETRRDDGHRRRCKSCCNVYAVDYRKTSPVYRSRHPCISKTIEMRGHTAGDLVVIGPAPPELCKDKLHSYWMAECAACGSVRPYTGGHLRRKSTKSCGCRRIANIAIAHIVHGGSARGKVTPEYKVWGNMLRRCFDPSSRGYKNYGGRGITVCDEWREDFAAFLAHVGLRPSPKHSLDRIKNERDYEPGNVKWSTKIEQCRNKRNNHYIEYRGEVRTLVEWSEVIGIPPATLRARMKRGWTVESTMTRPVDTKKRRNSI
jgi:hypothetical protein